MLVEYLGGKRNRFLCGDRAVRLDMQRELVIIRAASRQGRSRRPSTARRIANRLACRIFSSSISCADAHATHHTACCSMRCRSSSRRFADSFLLSLRPEMSNSGGRITAAATTGPARQPRPASSRPASRASPLTHLCSNSVFIINLFATKLANNPQTAPLHPLRFPKKLYLCKQRLITETEWLKSLFIKPTEFEGFRMEVLDTGVVGRPLRL